MQSWCAILYLSGVAEAMSGADEGMTQVSVRKTVRSEGGDEVPDFGGVFPVCACVEEEAGELFRSRCVVLVSWCGSGQCVGGCFDVAGAV